MSTLLHIMTLSFTISVKSDTAKIVPDSSYEHITHYIDTVTYFDDQDADGDWKNDERNRYRGTIHLPDDDMQQTYYASPWRKTKDA